MTSQCQHCGAEVSEQYARVFGDQENVVHRCPSCDCKARIIRGSAAGQSIDRPDPQNHPNRNRGHLVDSKSVDTGKGPVPDGGRINKAAHCPNCQQKSKDADEDGIFTCNNEDCRCCTFKPIVYRRPTEDPCLYVGDTPALPVTRRMQDALVNKQSQVVFVDRPAKSFDDDESVLLVGPDGVFAQVEIADWTISSPMHVNTKQLDQDISFLQKDNNVASFEDPLPPLPDYESLQEYVDVQDPEGKFTCYLLRSIGPAPEEVARQVATDGGSGGDRDV